MRGCRVGRTGPGTLGLSSPYCMMRAVSCGRPLNTTVANGRRTLLKLLGGRLALN